MLTSQKVDSFPEAANNALMIIPRCAVHGEQLVLRSNGTYEQNYCGTWYACSQCGYTVLLPSPEIARLYQRTHQ